MIDILIFALIAAFLVFRLRSVLGRRTGHERPRRPPFSPPGQRGEHQGAEHPGPEARPTDNVVQLPERSRDEPAAPGDAASSVKAGLTQIQIADPDFNPRNFLQGARMAFGMIVEAFAKGDTATLRPLLSDDLYDAFSTAIRGRLAEGEKHETSVKSIKSAEILEARMDGRTAFVTVKFVSEQVIAVRDEQGDVIEGDAEAPIEVTDIWTFARNTRASDPNWILVETRTPN